MDFKQQATNGGVYRIFGMILFFYDLCCLSVWKRIAQKIMVNFGFLGTEGVICA